MKCRNILRMIGSIRKGLIIILTPILLLPLPLIGQTGVAKCGYVLCIMSIFWTFEACPMAVTSLLPVILFPMLGIQSADGVSMAYTRQLNFLFIGGLLVAVAIEEWNLHRRIALRVLLMIGSRPCWVMLGFMLVTWLLSMWISNTATAAMMVPVAMAVYEQMTTIEENQSSRMKKSEVTRISSDEVELEDKSSSFEIYRTDENVMVVSKEDKNDDALMEMNEQALLSAPKTEDREKILLRKAMLLAVAYSANIGGFTTLIGTPANLVLPGALDSVFGKGASDSVDFVSWIGFSFPISIVCLVIAWLWLQVRFLGIRHMLRRTNPEATKSVSAYLKNAYRKLGPFKFGEKAVLGHFICLVILWLSRDPKVITGWKNVLGLSLVKDSTCAMLVSFSLFVFTSKPLFHHKSQLNSNSKDGLSSTPPLLEWKVAQKKLAWDVVLLLGAGFALAGGCEESGLTDWVGSKMTAFSDIPRAAFAIIISIAISLLTEFTSNTSTANIFIPLLSKLSLQCGIHPLYIVIPTTISCSFAFSLPIATPPNAIVFSYGSLNVMDLVSTGLVLNFICIFILNLFLNLTGIPIFDLNSPFPFNATTTDSFTPTPTTFN